jgi:hypothetical protein
VKRTLRYVCTRLRLICVDVPRLGYLYAGVESLNLEGETSRAALLRVHLQHASQHALREREVVFAHEPEPIHQASAPSVVYTETCEFATPVVEEGTRDGTSVVYSCVPLCDAETMGGARLRGSYGHPPFVQAHLPHQRGVRLVVRRASYTPLRRARRLRLRCCCPLLWRERRRNRRRCTQCTRSPSAAELEGAWLCSRARLGTRKIDNGLPALLQRIRGTPGGALEATEDPVVAHGTHPPSPPPPRAALGAPMAPPLPPPPWPVAPPAPQPRFPPPPHRTEAVMTEFVR